MLRQNSSSIGPDGPNRDYLSNGPEGLHLQRQLQQLEEIVLDSPRVPLTRRTLVEEDQLLDHLDQVRLSLPQVFQQAEEILQTKETILAQAREYAQEIIRAAEQTAAQIADEVKIVQQAELEAQKIRQSVQEDCDAARQRTSTDIERMRQQAQQDLHQMRSAIIAECEQLQTGADTYADRVLNDMEKQFSQVLQVIRHSRHHLHETASHSRPLHESLNSGPMVDQPSTNL